MKVDDHSREKLVAYHSRAIRLHEILIRGVMATSRHLVLIVLLRQ